MVIRSDGQHPPPAIAGPNWAPGTASGAAKNDVEKGNRISRGANQSAAENFRPGRGTTNYLGSAGEARLAAFTLATGAPTALWQRFRRAFQVGPDVSATRPTSPHQARQPQRDHGKR